jgi:hypothetical protein
MRHQFDENLASALLLSLTNNHAARYRAIQQLDASIR